MKIRTDFVTNSSSSSFICVMEVEYNTKLKEYLKEEFGKYGIEIANNYIVKGRKLNQCIEDYDYENIQCEIDDDKFYFPARFISYSDEGDKNGDDAWLYDHIPDWASKEIYRGCPD